MVSRIAVASLALFLTGMTPPAYSQAMWVENSSISTVSAPAPVTPAPAEAPISMSDRHIYDPQNLLGQDIYRVEAAIQGARDKSLDVYIALVDSFSGYAPSEWTSRTLQLSDLPGDSYILAIAVQDKQYYAASTQGSRIATSTVSDLATSLIAPQLSSEDFAAVSSSFIEGLLQNLSGSLSAQASPDSDSSSGSTSRWFFVILLGAMIAAVALAVALYRRASGPNRADEEVDFDALDAQDQVVEKEPGPALPEGTLAGSETAAVHDTYTADLEPQNLEPQNPEPFIPASTVVTEVDSPVEYQAVAYATPVRDRVEDEAVADAAMPALDEADYERCVAALHELGGVIFNAEEDVVATETALGTEAAQQFRDQLEAARHAYRSLANLIDNETGTLHQQADYIVTAAQQAKRNLTVEMVNAAKLRHDPAQVMTSLNRLTKAWNQARRELGESNQVAANLYQMYAGEQLEHIKANLNHAKILMQAAYRAIVAGQEHAKNGENDQALKYLRGAERAMVQSTQISQGISQMHEFLELSRQEIAYLQQVLREEVSQLPPQTSGPQVAMVERVLANAEETMQGHGNPLVALTKLYSAQTEIERAAGGEVDPVVLTQQFQTRLNHVSRLLLVERLNLRLRRKFTDPQLQEQLSNCDKMQGRAQEKARTDLPAAIQIINSSAELLVQLDSQIPPAFPAKG